MFIFLKYPGPYFFYQKEKKIGTREREEHWSRETLACAKDFKNRAPRTPFTYSYGLAQKRWDLNKRMNCQLHEIYVS